MDHTAELGGAELALARLLDALPATVRVTVVLLAEGPLAAMLRLAGHEVVVIPMIARFRSMDRHRAGGVAGLWAGARLIPFAIRLARRLRALDVDVIHTTSLKADLLGLLVAPMARRPLVWYIHDRITPEYLPKALVRAFRLLARQAPAAVIANSRATALTLTDDPKRVVVAYPGLAPSQVRPPCSRHLAGPPIVGVIGRVGETKAQLVFVRAAARVLALRPETQFMIVGSPMFGDEAYAGRVQDEIDRLGLLGHVTMTGFVADPVQQLDQLSVCVHTASVPEPFGQVVVEAMGRNVPVIATEGGGIDEILEPDPRGKLLGRLVPPADDEALAEAILEAINDPAESERRAAAAYASALDRFTIDKTARAVVDVWTQVASRRAAAPRPPASSRYGIKDPRSE